LRPVGSAVATFPTLIRTRFLKKTERSEMAKKALPWSFLKCHGDVTECFHRLKRLEAAVRVCIEK